MTVYRTYLWLQNRLVVEMATSFLSIAFTVSAYLVRAKCVNKLLHPGTHYSGLENFRCRHFHILFGVLKLIREISCSPR